MGVSGTNLKFLLVAAIVAAVGLAAVHVATSGSGGSTPEGRDAQALGSQIARPAVEAFFPRESYRPETVATLVVDSALRRVRLQIFRAGDTSIVGRRRDEMRGIAVTAATTVALDARQRRVRVSIGDWPSGMYYAELRANDGRVGYAPFVLAPRRLGEHRVAVVMPTNTWFAYNRRDADGDGKGDTWYADWSVRTVDMTRPFLDRGVPPYFNHYDLPFLRWLFLTGKQVDVLSQRELERGTSGEQLAGVYDLIVFPGHHEYVTAREYDVIERYRDLGGNLMFLSANNYFWKVVKHGDGMTRTALWRDLGRPESALIGVQYISNDGGKQQGPYRLRASEAGEWIFAATGLEPGSSFGRFGIEIDHTTRFSPAGTQIVAEIPDLHAPGKTAQMTYYETAAGAKVFAAGAFTLAGRIFFPVNQPALPTMLDNLWAELTEWA